MHQQCLFGLETNSRLADTFYLTGDGVASLCKHVRSCLHVTGYDAYQQMALCDPAFCFVFSSLCRQKYSLKGLRKDKQLSRCHLDHFIAMGLRISSSHGKDSDLLRLGAAVSQRQRHLPVGGAVCGVGPGNSRGH